MRQMQSRSYRLVIFDFDGTLADTFPWFCSVIDDVAVRFRFRRITPDERERLRGLDARAIMRALGVARWKLPMIARHMHKLATRDIEAITLFSGTEVMIRTLDEAGIVLAVVSSNTEANVRRVLGPSADRFRHYACGASLFGKARRLREVMRDAAVEGDAIYIGDELRDHEAASAAGCEFGAVSWGYTTSEALAAAEPAFWFSDPASVIRILDGATS